MKYIDADKLKYKVNELRQDWLGSSTGLEVAEEGAELGAAASILDSIDDTINSLQQEQSDKSYCKEQKDALEKELEQYRDFHGDWYGHTPDGKYVGDSFDFSDIKEFAQRIYNLK